jgi:hypothetical protein
MDESTKTLGISHRIDPAKKISKDWPIFTERLTSVLSKLKEDQFLIVSTEDGDQYVQFACQGVWGMRVEVPSNHFLKGAHRLNRRQMLWLSSHGWNAPTGMGKRATPSKDPDGSPNYFIDFPNPTTVSEISQIATDALVNAMQIQHPARLHYEAFDADQHELLFDELGLKPKPTPPLMERVLQVVRGVTGIAGLELDKDGDVYVRYGDIGVCATPVEKGLRLSTLLVGGIGESPVLLSKLNGINAGLRGIRCVHQEKCVYAALDLPANPFVPEQLSQELTEFASVAAGLAHALGAEFNGNTNAGTTANYIQ